MRLRPVTAPGRADRRTRRNCRFRRAAGSEVDHRCVAGSLRVRLKAFAPRGDRLRPVRCPHRQAGIDSFQQPVGKACRLKLGQRLVAIIEDSLHGGRRRPACHRVVERHRQAIDVGPRPLFIRRMLFRRGVARRENSGHCRGATHHRRPRGAEIDQGRVVLGIENDVGRLDIAVEEARRMNLLESLEQAIQQPLDDRRRQGAVTLQALLERLAARQRHHHVRRSVCLEVVVDTNDRRHALERHQRAGFVEEAFAAPHEILGKLGRARHDRRAAFAQRQGRRQVFLYRQFAAEQRVAREVGNAESSLAEDGNQLIVPQPSSRRQRAVEFVLPRVRRGISPHSGVLA